MNDDEWFTLLDLIFGNDPAWETDIQKEIGRLEPMMIAEVSRILACDYMSHRARRWCNMPPTPGAHPYVITKALHYSSAIIGARTDPDGNTADRRQGIRASKYPNAVCVRYTVCDGGTRKGESYDASIQAKETSP